MTEKTITKSYKVFFNSEVKTRILTKTKRNIIFNISNYFRSCTNFIYKENHEGYNNWKDMSKDDRNFVRKHYEAEFGTVVTSGYAQNLYKFANDKYNTTKKAYFSKYTQNKIKAKNKKLFAKGIISKKSYFKKPYSEDFLEFPLDNRMLKGSGTKAFIKDPKVKNLYWLSILNPFKKTNYKKNINIPLKLYPEILEKIEAGYKYSFALHNDYVKINFNIPVINLTDINKETKKLEKIGVDFGKYTSSFDGSNTEQWNLAKMYRKIQKILNQVSNFQSRIAELKEKQDYDVEYKELKYEVKRLFKRIAGIRKSAYGQIKNYLFNNYKEIIIEDLDFDVKEKGKSGYKGKNFNKILKIMGRGIWMNILEKADLVGNQLVKIDPRYSSQKCNSCGGISAGSRKGRQFNCLSCGHHCDADINAAMNIYQKMANI